VNQSEFEPRKRRFGALALQMNWPSQDATYLREVISMLTEFVKLSSIW
jgi:hypothetical protein